MKNYKRYEKIFTFVNFHFCFLGFQIKAKNPDESYYKSSEVQIKNRINDINSQLEVLYRKENRDVQEEALLKSQKEDLEARLKDIVTKERYSKIWKNNKYLNIGYVSGSIENEEAHYDSSYGFSLTSGTSFLYPKNAVGGIVKFGFDVNWFDFTITGQKKKFLKAEGSDDDEWGWYHDYYNEEDKCTSMLIGFFGIGPNITFAPFAYINSGLSRVKLSLFFHYVPTLGLQNYEDLDEWGAAYCNIFRFGGKLSWKMIGLGIEKHWGKSTNYSAFDEKLSYDNFRIYFSLCF